MKDILIILYEKLDGEYDIQDVGCPKEHWNIKNSSSVTEGKREVWVNLKELYSSDSNLTDTVTINIKALGMHMPLVVDVHGEDDYNIGHVADIIIEYEDNKPVPKLKFYPRNNIIIESIGPTGTRDEPTCAEQNPEYNCKCMPCSAQIIPNLEQALVGPLSGADFKIFEAVQYATGIALYEGKTSVGTSVLTAGKNSQNMEA